MALEEISCTNQIMLISGGYMALTEEQVTEFDERGVLIVEDVLKDSDFEPVIDSVTDFLSERARAHQVEGNLTDLFEEEPFISRYARLYEQCKDIGRGIDIMQMRARAMFEFLSNERLLDAVETLIGPEITCSPIQHIRAKPPSRLADGPDYHHNVPWHQDSGVTWEEADKSKIITCWIPLIDATVERGCMHVMPDVFQAGHLEHHSDGATTIKPEFLPQVTPLPLEVRKGGVVFLNQFTPHHSTSNLTEWDVRWSLDIRYQPSGTPTGRPFHPAFCVRSKADPGSVLSDHQAWCDLWTDAFEENARNPQQAHRV
jgi:phytanoyl-CoA hydroxylase